MERNHSCRLSKKKLVETYLIAKEEVIQRGYAEEVDWQDQLCFSRITETDFLREAAWVILSSGMREAVVRKKFVGVTAAFRHWESAQDIVENNSECQNNALKVFAHPRKISAILSVAERVHEHGYPKIYDHIRDNGVDYLQQFDFIGPVTRYHLAKNIGLDVVKPDRHLVRVAEAASYADPHALCEAIANETGDKLSVIDIVIWRFATVEPLYLDFFRV